MDTHTKQSKAESLTIKNLRQAIEISIAGFAGEPATTMNSGNRAHVFVCALSGMIGQYDKSLSDAIFSVIQPPAVSARTDEVLA